MRNNIFDQEMRGTHRDSITMCNLAAEALQDAMDAVRRRDFTMVDRVLELDKRIRNMRMAINERVMRMIATQHPVALDLRRLFYLIHTADEMERIGFNAARAAKTMLRSEQGSVMLMEELYNMSERVCTMFEMTLTGSLGENPDSVRAAIVMDDEVDVMHEQIYRECVARKPSNEDADVLAAISIARYIEHAGDHIVNWGRWWLYFCVKQEDDAPVIV